MKFSGSATDNTPSQGEILLKDSLKSNFRELLHEWIFFQMKLIRGEGLAVPQLFTLRYLYYNHPKDLSSIANFMGVSKPTVTGIMNTLEKDGFIRRERDSRDRRRVDLLLTQKSLDLFGRIESMSKFVVDGFIQSVPEDYLLKLGETMDVLAEKLRQAVTGREIEKKE